MINKFRVGVKLFYYIIGIGIGIFFTVSYSTLSGKLVAAYIFCGAVTSTVLKLPLLSKSSLFQVQKEYYSRKDLFCNILFSVIAILFYLYLMVK